MKKSQISICTIIMLMFLISITSAAVFCDRTFLDDTHLSMTCTNSGNDTVEVQKFGNYFDVNPSIPFDLPSSQEITISIDQNAPVGNLGVVLFSNSLVQVAVNNNQEPEDPPVQSDILVFPTSKITTVVQGEEKTQNILITVPSSYPRVITIGSVNFDDEKDPIKFGDLSLGQIAPGQSASIPIIFSGVDAQVGTYQSNLQIFVTDSQGQVILPNVNLVLQVSASISPTTNSTFSSPPSCSISASTMNINSTYSFVCSNVNNNLEVNPQYSDFFDGVNVDLNSGIYTYTFKPKKMGNFNFIAFFSYKGSPIYSPFSQEIRVTSTGSSLGGTDLDLLFTPSLEDAKEGETVAIQVIDNKTGNLVSLPELFIDSIFINSSQGDIFYYYFNINQDYDIRAKVPGYDDLLRTFSLLSQPFVLSISPESGNSLSNFNISSDVANVSLFIDGVKVDYPYYSSLSVGQHEIKAIAKGYIQQVKNITVVEYLRATLETEFKKGVNNLITLNENISWYIVYKKDLSDTGEKVLEGNGSEIQFIPSKKGFYTIFSDENKPIETYEISGWDWGKKWWFMAWYWWILIILVIIIAIFWLLGGDDEPSRDSGVPFGGNVNIQ